MVQSVAYFTGFETGDASEVATLGAGNSIQATILRSGGYALKASGTACSLVSGLSATQTSGRFYFYAPAGTFTANSFFLEVPTRFRLRFATGAAPKITASDGGSSLGLTLATGITNMSADAWHLVEFVYDLAAGGVVKVWVDGVLEINTTHTSDVSGTPTTGWQVAAATNPNEKYFDDVLIATGGLTPLGAGRCIARQGKAGTPAYNAWTKHGGAAADTCWSETPFDTTNYCDTTSLNAFQTMLAAAFSTDPSRAVEGTQRVRSGVTVNAAKVGLIGKSSATAGGAGAFNIRRRVSGADTDTAKTFTTADAYYETAPFSEVQTNLDSYEIGGGHGGVAATHTIRDVWMFVDFQPYAIAVGLATSASTAQTVQPLRAKTVGLASEADSAQTVQPVELHPVGLASETDTAQSVAHARRKTTGLASETDAAQSVGHSRAKAVGLASEADSAQPVTRALVKATGLAAETDAAQPVAHARAKAAGLAAETDAAQTSPPLRKKAVGLASEAETAQSVAYARGATANLASETDASFSIQPLRTRSVGIGAETDAALAAGHSRAVSMGVAEETDRPQHLLGPVLLDFPVENDAALAVTRVKKRSIGLVSETDAGQAVARLKTRFVGLASEFDVARSVVQPIPILIGEESDEAFGIDILRTHVMALALAGESDAALGFTIGHHRQAAARMVSSNAQFATRVPNIQ